MLAVMWIKIVILSVKGIIVVLKALTDPLTSRLGDAHAGTVLGTHLVPPFRREYIGRYVKPTGALGLYLATLRLRHVHQTYCTCSWLLHLSFEPRRSLHV